MKRKYLKISILLCLSLILFLSPLSKYLNICNHNSELSTIKTGTSWNLLGNVIDIEGDNPSKSWYHYASTYPWCFGSGTENDPYIIENVTIQGTGVEKLISIDDTQDFFIIRNCKLYGGDFGIYLDWWDVANGKIINNNISLNIFAGIASYYNDNISIIENIIQNNKYGVYTEAVPGLLISGNNITHNTQNGVSLMRSGSSQILSNNISANLIEGLRLQASSGCKISNNTVKGNGIGINILDFIDPSRENNVSQNIIQDNTYGIVVEGFYNNILNNTITGNTHGLSSTSENLSVINNTIKSNSGVGIIIGSSNNVVRGNTINFNQHGISLSHSNNSISNNTIENNSEMGINAVNPDQTIISNNIIENNAQTGIYAENVKRSIISNNSIRNNNLDGIYMNGYTSGSCEFNKILGNTIIDNINYGIAIRDHFNNNFNNNSNVISKNLITGHGSEGLYLYQSDNNFVSDNYISENLIGITVGSSVGGNNFTENNITSNINLGISIDANDAVSNQFYKNYFSDHSIHVNDLGTNNNWNSSTIGNYWDDNLVNTDVNDDGIGETPYLISATPLIQDYLPIFEDGDDSVPPIISIVNPGDYQISGKKSPNFQISIAGLYIHTKWYEIVGSAQKITFTGESGQIDQSLWEEFGNGTATIRFYVNDTLGYGTMDEVTIRKDIYEPELIINSPTNNNLYDNVAPTFNVEISDPNLDKMWYSINLGLISYPFTSNTSIDQTAWDSTPDGEFIINFYANDTASNLINDTVIVRKDTTAPLIMINSPTSLELFGKIRPSFNVEIYDFTLDTMWYTIEGALTNITFALNGTIDQILWNGFGSGNLNLIFFANDSTGLLSSDNIIITKDIDSPIISINDPTPGETFYANPPNFFITVNDPHLDSVWYTIDGGITNITITSYNSVIAQGLWAATAIGEVTLRFYAIDTLGNINYREVTVLKKSVSAPPSGPTVSGYDLYIIVSVTLILSVILVFKQKQKIF